MNLEALEPYLQKRKLTLEKRPEGLTLCGGSLTLRGDFTQLLPRLRRGNLGSELLVKAARIKGKAEKITVLDATAGLGEDSLLLAAAGFQVRLYEADPVIGALLEDALARAKEVPELTPVVSRMELRREDSIAAMQGCKERIDVVFLDPMFPQRQKSALVKKKFQLLQQLEQPCSQEEELLEAALTVHPRKIVIKRPAKGPYLAGRKPDYSLGGKAVRYDCLVLSPVQ